MATYSLQLAAQPKDKHVSMNEHTVDTILQAYDKRKQHLLEASPLPRKSTSSPISFGASWPEQRADVRLRNVLTWPCLSVDVVPPRRLDCKPSVAPLVTGVVEEATDVPHVPIPGSKRGSQISEFGCFVGCVELRGLSISLLIKACWAHHSPLLHSPLLATCAGGSFAVLNHSAQKNSTLLPLAGGKAGAGREGSASLLAAAAGGTSDL